MQFVGTRKREPVKDVAYAQASTYTLSFYDTQPNFEITMEQMEDWAEDRLRVLKVVENARANGMKGVELSKTIAAADDQFSLRKENKKDVVSHFVLRLAYCQNENLRRWFLTQENYLFRSRFEREEPTSKRRLLDKLGYKPLEARELESLEEELKAMTEGEDATWYSVPFEEVLELVGQRRVLLRDGTAYVRESEFISVIAGRFRQFISLQLVSAFRTLPTLEEIESDRIYPLLQRLTTAYLGPDYSGSAVQGDVQPDQIDALCNESFPLCMRSCHKSLRLTHHMKHQGRLQFGLFLKTIGLSLENALVFWKQEFSQGVGAEKFEKNYAYNIRHNYGQEGKRVSYTPFSCSKIIQSMPGAGECHGCPYRVWDTEHLSASLQSMKIDHSKMRPILDKAKEGHYQIACLRHFEAMHPGAETSTLSIVHPNAYYDASVAYWKAKRNPDANPPTANSSQAAKAPPRLAPIFNPPASQTTTSGNNNNNNTEPFDPMEEEFMLKAAEEIEATIKAEMDTQIGKQ